MGPTGRTRLFGPSETWIRRQVPGFASHRLPKGEILRMQWSQVDLLERTIRLEPGTTKNKEGRTIPLAADASAPGFGTMRRSALYAPASRPAMYRREEPDSRGCP